ncbi:MAG: MBL fold metallo-hydrolase [Deltaproteobacteria bacterium]|nr:MBL fold metallo-hydrolase [Deltaproteobacteria bacterium]
MQIDWLGHDGMRIMAEGLVIYIDPYHIEGGTPADIVLVTHGHYDHCSPEDIEKILKNDTVIVCPPRCEAPGNTEVMRAWETREVKGVKIETVPAYNMDKKFHPKADGHVGYIATLEGQRVYHAGDTDHIPEMSDIECDIALLPVSGTYVMTAEEAVEAAKVLKPKLAVPMHYGAGVVGTVEDAERFASLLEGSGIEVEIKEKA